MFNYVWIIILLFIVICLILKCIHNSTFVEQVLKSITMTLGGLIFGVIITLIITIFITSVYNFCANYNLFGLVAQTNISEVILYGVSVGMLIGGLLGFILSFIIDI